MAIMASELTKLEKQLKNGNEQTDQERFEFGTQLANIAMGVSEHADVSIVLQTRRQYVPERPLVEVGIASPHFMTGGVDFLHRELFRSLRNRKPSTSLTRRVPGEGHGYRTEVVDDILTDADGNMTRRRTSSKLKGLEVLDREVVRERPASDQTILAMARLAAIQVKAESRTQ